MSEHASVCPLDCPDTCSLTVTVEHAKIVKIRGSRANPYTAGVICTKVAGSYPEWVHGPGRLQTPLRRIGAKGEGRFAPVSWDEALDIIHERVTSVIAAHGPQSVLPLNYAGPHGMLGVRLHGPALLPQAGRVAAGPLAALRRHPHPGLARHLRHDARHRARAGARTPSSTIAWGNNVTWSNLHLTPIINAARRDGAKVVVVDPKRIKIAEQADMHVALKPGTDVVLAWALAAELERRGAFDRAFIERHVTGFEEFMADARRYSVADAARDLPGAGGADPPARGVVPHALARLHQRGQRARAQPERRQRHPRDLRAARAGREVRGAGRRPRQRRRLRLPEDARQAAAAGPAARRAPARSTSWTWARTCSTPTLSPPIKALFVYNHNPLVVHPDQNRMRRGLAREDLFVVGCDVVMTDSLAYADVVLPASQPLRVRRHLRGLRPALAAARRAGDPARSTTRCPTPRSSGGWPRASASPIPIFTRQRRRSSWTTRWTAPIRAWAAWRRAGCPPTAPPR